MQRWFALPLALASLAPLSAWGQSTVYDEFNASDLNLGYWCPCQIKTISAPVTFPTDPTQPGDRVARIVVDDASLGGNVCRSGSPEFECRPPLSTAAFIAFEKDEGIDAAVGSPEPLGPTLIRPPGVATFGAVLRNPYCTEAVLRRAMDGGEEGQCIQRQELRLQKQYTHNADEPRLYSVRFRLPDSIEDRISSLRWVTAQWKQETVSESYRHQFGDKWAPSPFLAQRFDDGVLHVTVQDEHCRCMVASAPYPDGSILAWRDGRAQYCASTKPEEEGRACMPDLYVQYGPNPVLSSGLGSWMEMRYRVEASRSGGAVIELYEVDRLIVRVTGKIGYEPKLGEQSVVKFKIGHYRDYMPFAHAMEIDWLGVAPVRE
jgi:hypothetical protein